MNKRFPLYLILSMMLGFIATSCNDDKEDEELLDDPYRNSLMVTTFSLEKNDSVLVGLDSVFFSIDLERAVIFNADSLPKGTKVNRLKVAMTLSSVAVAELTMPNDQGADTVVNFLTNASDSINFSRGFVKLHLESANKEYKRDYTIYVNVHKTVPDSLAWGKNAWAVLPSTLAKPTAQHTVEYNGSALCFTTDGSAYSLAVSDNPATGVWQKSSVTLPAGARIESITASADRLYLLTADNSLYQSADGGQTWTATGASMNHIYGCMGGTVYGNRLGCPCPLPRERHQHLDDLLHRMVYILNDDIHGRCYRLRQNHRRHMGLRRLTVGRHISRPRPGGHRHDDGSLLRLQDRH